MKNVVEQLSEVGFFESKDFKTNVSEKKLSSDTIITTLQSKNEVPNDILLALRHLESEEDRRMMALNILRMNMYAKTLTQGKGNIKGWFLSGKVNDLSDGSKIQVNIINKTAQKFCKTTENIKKNSDRVEELEKRSKTLTKNERLSLDKNAAKVDSSKESFRKDAEDFMQAIDLVYLSLASERK